MTARLSRSKLALSACVLALALAGCSGSGGGGGGSGGVTPITPVPPPPPPPPSPPPPPPPPPPPASSFNDAEYQRSNGANFEGAITAYNAGATGQGIKIGLVDTGVNPNLPDFTGKIDPASGDVAGGNRGVTDQSGHGTATAATAAAARNGSGILGVAFDATIVSENSSSPTSCTSDKCDSNDTAIARGIDAARVAGARVINISLGSNDPSSVVNAAIARAASAGIVVVMSAGNSGTDATTGPNPEGFAASAAANNANVIIAGAVDSTRTIADFSNRAGTSASSYLTALGSRVVAPDNTGTLFFWSGTSFSAPVISGAVALLAQAFPNLTGQQIIAILYQSADDAGAPGVDAVYGHGILNIARAFQPVGTLSLPDSKIAFNPLPGNGTTSGPMGDASPRVKGVIVLDGFSRAFAINFAQTLRQAPQEQPLTQALQPGLSTAAVANGPTAVSLTVRRDLMGHSATAFTQLGLTREDARQVKVLSGLALTRLSRNTAIAFGISESGRTLQQRLAAAADHAFLVARDPMTRMGFYANAASSVGVRQSVGRLGITLTSERGHVYEPWADPRLAQPRYGVDSMTLDRRFGRALLSLGASRLSEQQTVLGAQLAGPVAAGGATSWFADAGGRYDFGHGWGLAASYRRGWTSMPGLGGLARDGRLSTDAWSFDIAKGDAFRPGDSFAIRLMQPLRVRSGGLNMVVPVAYDYSTLTASYEAQFFNLAPTGREIDLEAVYGVPFLGGRLTANAYARRQPGNIAALAPDIGTALRFSVGF
ncbi:MAG TPA: S8 family peptidase [Allosphingosinicella sp.]|jgi:hypothetical protein|nr:S8 family peptidase [Allosphingosinicella sp.]